MQRSRFCNPFNVTDGELAIDLLARDVDTIVELSRDLRTVLGKRLVCCTRSHRCNADALIQKFVEMDPESYDFENSQRTNVIVRNHRVRKVHERTKGFLPKCRLMWSGRANVCGVGYTCGEHCNVQGLASPERWPVARRKYPDSFASQSVGFVEQHGTPELPMVLALGRVKECSFSAADVQELKEESVVELAAMDMELTRCTSVT